jgi:hypothetical protein
MTEVVSEIQEFYCVLFIVYLNTRCSTCILRGTTVLVELWPPHIFYARFRDSKFVQDGVVSPTPKPPTWRTRVSLLVWHLPRNLTGMGGPTSSYAAAGMALEFIGAHKPLTQQRSAFDKVEIPSRGALCSN